MAKQAVKKKSKQTNDVTSDESNGNKTKPSNSNNIYTVIIVLIISITIANYNTIISKLLSQKPKSKEILRPQKTNMRSNNTSKFKILDELFPNNTLDNAWEKYPLLITSSSSPHYYNSNTNAKKNITTYKLTKRQTQKRINHTSTIFSLSSLEVMLSQNHHRMKHGDDFILAKKIKKEDGEEWMGRLPYETVPLQEIANHLYYGGFSLVVNKLQKLWRKVSDVSREIETDTFCYYVSCNLYMTPQADGVRSAFEAHYDWMDVIVVQITGYKLWSVATKPLVRLTTYDLKRKPTLKENDEYFENSYNDFLLSPGDVLYIPRGFIHNASTVALPHDEQKQSPSIHLSFGIEHLCDTTWEAFLHHALVHYTNQNKHLKKEIVLSKEYCNTPISWNVLFHYTISAMARLDVMNGNNDDAYLLRQSVPLHPLWEDIRTSNTTFRTMYTPLLQYLTQANVKHTIKLFNLVQKNFEMREHFCIPGVVQPALSSPAYTCKNVDYNTLQKAFINKFQFFLEYVNDESVYDTVRKSFVVFLEGKKKIAFKNDDDLLTIG